jgi:hypothetical protein
MIFSSFRRFLPDDPGFFNCPGAQDGSGARVPSQMMPKIRPLK